MKTNSREVFRLADYKILDYLVKHVDLEIDLTKNPVQSRALLTIEPNHHAESRAKDLELDGENMVLLSAALNGHKLNAKHYELTQGSIVIKNIPQNEVFTLETINTLGENTDLFGLYETEGTVLVKAETEGLRRVFYCQDRPDSLATYKTTIIASKKDYPILLSNGSLIEEKNLAQGIHSVTWLDTLPKPSYLFALVAGKLQKSVTHYTTQSGRNLPIEFYLPPKALAQCEFAKEVLKEAMRWEEEVFHLECELAQHMVAGVDKYASGASEPTGLNLFNTANLYATPATKKDTDILRVLEVVAHEYFHYWTGDRVTIREWFNLPFKEGLTTFRAAMFREQLFGTDLIRLLDGKNLDERAPRPDTYTHVRSLYTPAAYEKSADIFRMMMLFLGEDLFYSSMTQFLKENDQGAVTLENVLDSLTATTGRNMRPFLSWFTESGVPQITASDFYDAKKQQYTLIFKAEGSKNRPIPILLGLLDKEGEEIIGNTLIILNQPETTIQFDKIKEAPTPSLLRSFSAPVQLQFAYTKEQLLLLMQYDTNTYNRCEAKNQLITEMVSDYCNDQPLQFTPEFFNVFKQLLTQNKQNLNYWLLAELLKLPSEEELFTSVQPPKLHKIVQARQLIQKRLAKELKQELWDCKENIPTTSSPTSPFTLFDIDAAGLRRFKAVCHSYLFTIEAAQIEEELIAQFYACLDNNMTDTLSALTLLMDNNSSIVMKLLEYFYQNWQHDVGAVNYWFNVQAASHSVNAVQRVASLMQHPAFDLSNPNKVNALLGTFTKNPYGFHALSGAGYQLVANAILKLEPINPTLAARLTEKFIHWSLYDEQRQKMMLGHLEYLNTHALTDDVRNMAKKGLDKKGKTEPPQPVYSGFFRALEEIKNSAPRRYLVDKCTIHV